MLGGMLAAALAVTAPRVDTVEAWNRYLELTELRVERELEDRRRFLVHEFFPPAEADEIRRILGAGEIVVRKLETRDASGERIDVPGGMVHHWYGAVLVRGASVAALVSWLQDYDAHQRYFAEVERSRLLAHDGDAFEVSLRLRRKKIVTVHYDTVHRVIYRGHGEGRASSASEATRIAELENAGTVHESAKSAGDDRGFLWRLASFWRFQQTPEGVVVECESVSLSRSVPAAVRLLVGRYLDSVPRESLEATLGPIRDQS